MIRSIVQFFVHPTSRALGIVFATLSVLFGSWVTRIPDVMDKLALSEGEFGLALLGISVGSLVTMPLTPLVMKRFSLPKTVIGASWLCCVVFILPVIAPTYWLLVVALVAVGMVNGILDVAVNAATAAVEREQGLVIMSSCHGMFSLGGVVGATLGSLLAGWQVSIFQHLLLVGLGMLVINLFAFKTLSQLSNADSEEAHFAIPTKALLGLSLIGFCIMIGEGAIADWSAIYLRDVIQSSAFLVGLGFAGFNLTMTIGRFMGDWVVLWIGSKNLVKWGSLVGGFGILVSMISTLPLFAILGFTLVGVGFSTIIPIVFRAAANVPGVPSSLGVAAVTSTGFTGFLIGPPLIGFLADGFGLRVGFGFVLFLALVSFLVANRVRL